MFTKLCVHTYIRMASVGVSVCVCVCVCVCGGGGGEARSQARRSAVARMLIFRVRIPPEAWMSVCC